MHLSPRALKSLNSIEKIQPRIIVATFNGNPSITIISCYSPTNASNEKGLNTFYNEPFSLVRSIPKHNVLIIGGDINAQIMKKKRSLLNNRDICDRCTMTLKKFDALQEISETPTPNDEYENFVNVHMESAAECIPTKLRVKHRFPGRH